MATPASRRAVLTAFVVAGSLAAAAALIVWQTARPAAVKATHVAEPAAELGAPFPHDPARAAATPPALSALAGSDSDPERALAAEVRSLVAAGRIGKARSRANAYYERFPAGPSTAELERLTGAHPRRDVTDRRP
jgi:hypothetical protein